MYLNKHGEIVGKLSKTHNGWWVLLFALLFYENLVSTITFNLLPEASQYLSVAIKMTHMSF